MTTLTLPTEAHIVTYGRGTDGDGKFWLLILIDGTPHDHIGPFDTEDQVDRVGDDQLLLEQGAADIPDKLN